MTDHDERVRLEEILAKKFGIRSEEELIETMKNQKDPTAIFKTPVSTMIRKGA